MGVYFFFCHVTPLPRHFPQHFPRVVPALDGAFRPVFRPVLRPSFPSQTLLPGLPPALLPALLPSDGGPPVWLWSVQGHFTKALHQGAPPRGVYFFFRHRARAARRAISRRSSGGTPSQRALPPFGPPFLPPFCPSATAWGFFLFGMAPYFNKQETVLALPLTCDKRFLHTSMVYTTLTSRAWAAWRGCFGCGWSCRARPRSGPCLH